MSLCGKFVSELQISAAAEKYYKIFKHQPFHFPNICPNIIQKIQHHGGDWDSHGHGSIKTWNFTVDGKAEIFKERVEFDEEKLAVTMTGLEGDVFNHYKSIKTIYQVESKGPELSSVVLTLEFEKLHDGAPHPYKYLDLMYKITKAIEAHLK